MEQTQQNPSIPPNPFSPKKIYRDVKTGYQTGQEISRGISNFSRAIFGISLMLVRIPASPATLLTRRRMGLLRLLGQVPMSFLVLTGLIAATGGSPLLVLWLFAVVISSCVHMVKAALRLYWPARFTHHVRRDAAGEAGRTVSFVLQRLPGWLTTRPVGVAFSEASLVLSLGAVVFVADPVAGALAVAAAVGILGESLVAITQKAWQLAVLEDQRQEQTELSQELADRGSTPDQERPVEAVTSIDFDAA
ncbi:MAG: hypothetical protein AAGJ54_08270 [Planctomycetota bacterium]